MTLLYLTDSGKRRLVELAKFIAREQEPQTLTNAYREVEQLIGLELTSRIKEIETINKVLTRALFFAVNDADNLSGNVDRETIEGNMQFWIKQAQKELVHETE